MKRRVLISIILISLLVISLLIVIPLTGNDYNIIYSVFSTVFLALTLVYLFGGTAKFIVMLIYSIIIIVTLILFPDYQYPIIAIGTLFFILNPLANLETWMEKRLTEEDVLPIRISFRGRYWPFYTYRQEMKNYVRMPQTKKLYTKSWYLRTRQLVTIALLFAAIYLFINELKNIYFDLAEYNLIKIFTFYGVITLFTLTFILFKNGFTAAFRAAIMFVFIPIIYAIWFLPIELFSKIILSSVVAVIGIADVIYEKFVSLNRVAYSAYKYYDPVDQRYIYANAFYEPLVYNETYNIVGIYKFKASSEEFHEKLHDILFHSNVKHFMITAYTFDGSHINIYTEFYQKHAKRAKRFTHFLETLFHTKVDNEIVYDKSKQVYEETFFHKTEYIVARALALSELVDNLSIGSDNVIISVIFSFGSLKDIKSLSRIYYVTRLEDYDDHEYFAVRVNVRSSRSKFAIEQKVRDVLLNALIYRGNYVRISLYYEGDNKND